ncbi:NatB MDM20 domain containing protein [Trichuris trichiura]|uniref:NatB MDM20 domain containing protein n=1 Tax=Trichuris trichiura TaxID=36087 RepID=A0A077ZMA8_TRITR|nr:NatB MDM20 domain containing protein [Trichuris trichiura]
MTYPQNVKQSRTQQLSRLNIVGSLLENGYVKPSELASLGLSEPSELMVLFFDMFGSRPCVLRDLIPFLPLVSEEQRDQFIERLRHSASDLPVCPAFGENLVITTNQEIALRHANLLHLCSALGYYNGLNVEHRQALIEQSLKHFSQMQPSPQEEFLNGDHAASSSYLLFACCQLWQLFVQNEDQQQLLKLAALLDEDLQYDKSNTVFRILLIKVYALLGSPCCLTAEFNALDAKYILIDDDFEGAMMVDRRDFSVVPILADVKERSRIDEWNRNVFRLAVCTISAVSAPVGLESAVRLWAFHYQFRRVEEKMADPQSPAE